MRRLTVHQQKALRYASIKVAGDREVAAAERMRHASSSAPALQHWFEERGGWLIVFVVIGAAVSLTACGEWRARPDLKVSTLTKSSAACVRGHKTEQVGTMGLYGTPVVVVTAARCEVKAVMQRALAWWMSAPVDEKTAVFLMVAPGALLTTLLAILPPHH